jgi:ACS family glucarate transporter-like MFS transporter
MSNPLELPDDRPTKVRYTVVLVTALMAVLLYLDRFCISFAQGFIRDDLGLSNTAVDWILAAFFLSYALMQVPAGWLTDRFGARLMLTLYILLWSLFTGLTGAAYGFAVLFVLRLAFGAAQAGAYPTGAAVVSKWVPLRSRGTASSVIAVGGRIGGWAAFYITGLLIVWLVPVSVSSRLAAVHGRPACRKRIERQRRRGCRFGKSGSDPASGDRRASAGPAFQ